MDSKSLKILRIYNSRLSLTIEQLAAILDEPLPETSEYAGRLFVKKYLRIELIHAARHGIDVFSEIKVNTPLQITVDGKEAVENADQARKQRRNDMIRYIITTAIAVAALITAIVSIALQYR